MSREHRTTHLSRCHFFIGVFVLSFLFADGKEEARKQDEERPAERRVPRAARQAEALLQNRQRLQRGEKTNMASGCLSFQPLRLCC